MMHKKFQMSSMGELTFFLGLQVKQKEDGIFISQDKYVNEILNKFGFSDVKTARTPIETQKALLKDADGEDVDEHLYRSMIGSLMYLTSSRPDIMFAVCACARFQVNPKSSHLHAVKRIFRYLKGQPKLGLWYPKDLPFDLVAYTDIDCAGGSLDRKSITGDSEYIAASNCCGQLMLPDITYYCWATAGSVNAVKLNLVMLVQVNDVEEPMADETANVESVPTHSNDPLLSGEDRLKLNELMELYTSLSQRVLALETTKTAQAKEIASLKKRVKKLEGKMKSKPSGMKRLFKIGRFAQVVSSEDEEMFDTGILDGEEVFAEQDVVEKEVSTAEVATNSTTATTVDELTLAQTLIEIKAAKPKAVTRPNVRGVVVQEPCEFTITTTLPSQPSQLPQVKDKGKAKMVEPGKPLKKKDQIMHDQKVALNLQAQFDAELEEEEKLAKQREEDANIAEWDNIQAMMDADYELVMLFDKQMKRVNTFVDMNTELVKGSETRTEGSSKRAGEELESEILKKQKLGKNIEAEVDDKAEMKKHMEIVPDDEVAIDAIPLATKPPIIVDWKIIKERNASEY
ncbi:putative ribonuclease H-like domain-containing protein [Tanacetum coccineum]